MPQLCMSCIARQALEPCFLSGAGTHYEACTCPARHISCPDRGLSAHATGVQRPGRERARACSCTVWNKCVHGQMHLLFARQSTHSISTLSSSNSWLFCARDEELQDAQHNYYQVRVCVVLCACSCLQSVFADLLLLSAACITCLQAPNCFIINLACLQQGVTWATPSCLTDSTLFRSKLVQCQSLLAFQSARGQCSGAGISQAVMTSERVNCLPYKAQQLSTTLFNTLSCVGGLVGGCAAWQHCH